MVSFLFLLLVLFSEKLNDVGEKEDERIELLKLDFGEVVIWKEKQQWLSSTKSLSEKKVMELAANWIKLLKMNGKQSFVSSSHINRGKTVLLYFFNRQQPIVCKLSAKEGGVIIEFLSTSQHVFLKGHQLSDYFP